MANDPTPDHTRWWLLWLFSTVVLPVVLPVASFWTCMLLHNRLPIDGMTVLLILLCMAVLCVWLLCFASVKAITPRRGALLAVIIIGGLLLQISSVAFGCLVGIGH